LLVLLLLILRWRGLLVRWGLLVRLRLLILLLWRGLILLRLLILLRRHRLVLLSLRNTRRCGRRRIRLVWRILLALLRQGRYAAQQYSQRQDA
jgi:hypothetical protein